MPYSDLPSHGKGIVVRNELDDALSSYVEAEASFRRSLDAGSDRLFWIAKSAALRNAAFDRYQKAVERQSLNIKPHAA